MRDQILEGLETRSDLPVFPDILQKLQDILNDQSSAMSDIARVINLDPGLSGRILSLSNSAFYSTGIQEITTLEMAVNKLGVVKIKHFVYSMEITRLFDDIGIIDYAVFWRHCLAVAIFTQYLSRYTGASQEVQDIAYLSGLMHDVGIMVFCYLIPEEYGKFIETVSGKELFLEKEEKRCFGIDHAELGALFIKRWWIKNNNKIIHAVQYNHFPFKGDEDAVQCEQLINIANGICTSQGFGNGIKCFAELFSTGAWDNMGLSLNDVDSIIDDMKKAIDQAMGMLNK